MTNNDRKRIRARLDLQPKELGILEPFRDIDEPWTWAQSLLLGVCLGVIGLVVVMEVVS
jgi:hypothetical protein